MNEYEVEKKISKLLSEGKWKDIINFVNSDVNFEARRLLWVWPTFNDLNWIKIIINDLKLKGIVSIGCGTGLLEWIIQQHSGCNFIGVEADQLWWNSKYSPPIYLNNIIFNERNNNNLIVPSDFAILFCYFNNGQAFDDYIKNYYGKYVFIIGPDDGHNRCTDPLPFDKKLIDLGWILFNARLLDNKKDFITIYSRRICN